MDVGESSLPASISPNNFPAKLWRLVNNPVNKSICWDISGQMIIIDQYLFEREVLSPGINPLDVADAFKTTNFSSFVRQLNLYGFKKPDVAITRGRGNATYHCFSNLNFKRGHPELVASLKRLTVNNKAKIKAGVDVKSRPQSGCLRYTEGDGGRDKNVKRVSAGSSSLLSPTHQEPTHPYYSNKAQVMTVHKGTPVPPQLLMRGHHGAAFSPTVFATDKRIPVSLSHHYAGVATSSNAMHVQQGLLASANQGSPNFTFSPNAQYQPGYYSPVCHSYHPNLVATHMAGVGLQTGSFSPHSYYQPRYPMLCHMDPNLKLKNKENQEVKKCDIFLDTVFQFADEVMETPPNNTLVRVVTPEKPGPVLVPFSISSILACNAKQCDNPASTMKANPECPAPIIQHVSDKTDLVKYEQQEEYVISVPAQMPEDAISEVTTDDAKDTEVRSDKGSNTEGYQMHWKYPKS